MDLPARSWTRDTFWSEAQGKVQDPNGILKFYLDLVQAVALTGMKYENEKLVDGSSGERVYGLRPVGDGVSGSTEAHYYLMVADNWITMKIEITPALLRVSNSYDKDSMWFSEPVEFVDTAGNMFKTLRISANSNECDIYLDDIKINYLSGNILSESFETVDWSSRVRNVGDTLISRVSNPFSGGSGYSLLLERRTGSHSDMIIDLNEPMNRLSSNITITLRMYFPYSQYMDDISWGAANQIDVRLYPEEGLGYKCTYRPLVFSQPKDDDDIFIESVQSTSFEGTPDWVEGEKSWFFDDFIIESNAPYWVGLETYFEDDFINTGVPYWKQFWLDIGLEDYFTQLESPEAPINGGEIQRNSYEPAGLDLLIASMTGDYSIEYGYKYSKNYPGLDLSGVVVQMGNSSDKVELGIGRDIEGNNIFVLSITEGGVHTGDVELTTELTVGADYFLRADRFGDNLYVYFASSITGETPDWGDPVVQDVSFLESALQLRFTESLDTSGDGFSYFRMQAETGFFNYVDYFPMWDSFWPTEIRNNFIKIEEPSAPIESGLIYHRVRCPYTYKVADLSGDFNLQFGMVTSEQTGGWEIRYDIDNYLKLFLRDDQVFIFSVVQDGSEILSQTIFPGVFLRSDLFAGISRTGSVIEVKYSEVMGGDGEPIWVTPSFSYSLPSSYPEGDFELRVYQE